MSTRPSQAPSRLSLLNHRQLAVDHQQHAIEFVAAAQDQPARRDHAVNPLLACEPRIFFDALDRYWGGFKSSARFQIDDEQFRFIPVINKAV